MITPNHPVVSLMYIRKVHCFFRSACKVFSYLVVNNYQSKGGKFPRYELNGLLMLYEKKNGRHYTSNAGGIIRGQSVMYVVESPARPLPLRPHLLLRSFFSF